jgi:hypothetical protein
MDQTELKRLAAAGIKLEVERLNALLKELDSTPGAFPVVERVTLARDTGRQRKRPPMTAAQRKEVSQRMKRMWAEKRAQKG